MSRKAVILAGGKGSRLGPYTTVLPKPLLPVGDRAILDVVVGQLRSAEFGDITLAVDHLARLIKIVFGDGSEHGVQIAYSESEKPQGTAGALRDIDGLDDEPFLAMNGDVLTTLDYEELYEAHLSSDNALTLACQQRVVPVDYGVLRVKGNDSTATAPIVDYEEKPEIHYTVSMGVYVISPSALRHIPSEGVLDIPDLVLRLIDAGERVGSYRYDGLWLDIGRHDDYERALSEYGPARQGPITDGSKLGAVASSAHVAAQP
ncbi:MAG TPA: sugar phosphate nucleotidyltransferase [Solirubrobacterales bacterium]